MTTNRRARVLIAGALAGTLAAMLAGCSGPEESPDASESAGTTSPRSESPAETVDPAAAIAGPPRVDVPPADEIARAFTVPLPRYRDDGVAIDMLGPVFTEDLVLFTDDHDFLYAIDRATGVQRWRVKRHSEQKDGDTPCSLTVPTPDADVVVMNHGAGDLCGYFTVYSLADGSITEKYDSVSRAGRRINFTLASNSDLVVVEGRTYFLDADDNLLRLEADGTTSSVGSPTVLVDADKEWTAHHLVALPGSDVLMARVQLTDGEVEFDEDEDGKLIGFRINDSDLPELVWEQDIRALMSRKSSPGHVSGKFQISPDVPGAIVDLIRADSGSSTRYRVVDPETGELSSPGYTIDRDNPAELPGFVSPYVTNLSLRADDSSVFTPIARPGQSSSSAVRRLDFASGDTMWSWPIPGAGKGSSYSSDADVISTSPDGALLYVHTTVGIDARLWELDADTGEAVRNWRFSAKQPEVLDLTNSTVTLDDGDVFRFSSDTYGDKLLAALYR